HFDPDSGVGVVDYISPARTFPLQPVGGVSAGSISIDTQRNERIELPRYTAEYNKFRQIKAYLINLQLEEAGIKDATGVDPGGLALLRKLFRQFFPNKLLIGAKTRDNRIDFLVRTPAGEHDIDLLSSGEQELFSIFVNLFRIRNLPAIVLYDE